jgi:hypothetical protein
LVGGAPTVPPNRRKEERDHLKHHRTRWKGLQTREKTQIYIGAVTPFSVTWLHNQVAGLKHICIVQCVREDVTEVITDSKIVEVGRGNRAMTSLSASCQSPTCRVQAAAYGVRMIRNTTDLDFCHNAHGGQKHV